MNGRITFEPDHKSVSVSPGTTVLTAAGKARVLIRSRCGGNASCLMCKVTAEQQAGLSPISPNERHKLGPLADQGIRLACQARVVGEATVVVPEDPLRAAVRAQLAKQQEEDLW